MSWGLTNLTGTSSFNYGSSLSQAIVLDVSAPYIPASNETLDSIDFYGRDVTAPASLVGFAIYDITDGLATASLLWSEFFTIATAASAGWNSFTPTTPPLLTSGRSYCRGFARGSAGQNTELYRVAATNYSILSNKPSETSFPDPSGTGSSYSYNIALYYNTSSSSSQTIADVNSGAGVKIGSTGNLATITGAPSAATGGTLGGKAITVTNWAGGVATFTAPAIVDGETFPEFNSNQTLVITGSDWSASLAGIALNTPTGSTLVTIASPDLVDQRKLGYHFKNTLGVTVVDDDQYYGIDVDVEWLPDTGGSAADLPVTTPVTLRDASSGIVYLLNVTVNPDGVVPPTYQKRYNQPAHLNPVTGLWGSAPYIALPDQGAGFTLTGSGFGTKTGYSDHINTSGIYDLDVDSNFGVIGRWDGGNYVGASNRPVVKAAGITGNKCLYFFQDVFGAPGRSPNNCLVFNYDSAVALGSTIFASRYVKHSSTSTNGGQWKYERYQKSTSSLSDKASETYYNASSASGATDNKIQIRDYRGTGQEGETLSDDSNTAKMPHNKDLWIRMDTLINLPSSYANRGEYSHKVWVYYDPMLPPAYFNFTDENFTDMVSPYGQAGDEWLQHLYQNYFGNGDFGTSTHDLWMDKCFESIGDDKRLEFCNSPTWGSQTKSYTQPLGSWTGTSIEIEAFDRGDLSSGWLHVISNNESIFSRRLG